MEQEILDYFEEEESGNNYAYLIPYFILWFGMIISGIAGLLYEIQHQIGLILLLLTGVTLLVNKRRGILLYGVTLLLGIINVGNYFPFETSIGVWLDSIILGFDYVMFMMSGFFLHFCMDDFKPQFQRLYYGSQEEQLIAKSSRIERFKTRFKEKSTEELNEIVANQMLIIEARKAAKEIIMEREGSKKQNT
jgi:hypothetical protein